MSRVTTGGDRALLGIYLNDHLAGVAAGGELAKRLAAAQRGKPAAAVLARITREVLDDRLALLEVMADLGVPVRRYKAVGAWVAERIGWLKLNGHLFRRSPLSGVVELEALRLVIEGQGAAWRALRLIATRPSTPRRWTGWSTARGHVPRRSRSCAWPPSRKRCDSSGRAGTCCHDQVKGLLCLETGLPWRRRSDPGRGPDRRL